MAPEGDGGIALDYEPSIRDLVDDAEAKMVI